MIILTLVVLGVALGSFINALVWRLHQQANVRSKKAKQAYSISTGRSMCTTCRHELAAKDLIPVLSYVWLKGRCRYCRAPIADTPIPELLTPAVFVISYMCWPFAWSSEGTFLFASWLVLLVGLIALAVYDLKWFLLPNRILFPLYGIVGLQIIGQLILSRSGWHGVVDALWGFVVGGGIFWALFQISDGRWIGGGDVKLGWLLGLLLGGPAASLLMIFIASVLGTVVSVPLLAAGKANSKTHLPFGPFLIVASIIVQLFGSSMILWYKRQLGLY